MLYQEAVIIQYTSQWKLNTNMHNRPCSVHNLPRQKQTASFHLCPGHYRLLWNLLSLKSSLQVNVHVKLVFRTLSTSFRTVQHKEICDVRHEQRVYSWNKLCGSLTGIWKPWQQGSSYSKTHDQCQINAWSLRRAAQGPRPAREPRNEMCQTIYAQS